MKMQKNFCMNGLRIQPIFKSAVQVGADFSSVNFNLKREGVRSSQDVG